MWLLIFSARKAVYITYDLCCQLKCKSYDLEGKFKPAPPIIFTAELAEIPPLLPIDKEEGVYCDFYYVRSKL